MELLNHFVAARLIKDAELFERIGQYDGAQNLLGRVTAAPRISHANGLQSVAEPATCPMNDDPRMRRSG
jgi:hypothetical protein